MYIATRDIATAERLGQELLRGFAGPGVNAAIAFLLIVTFDTDLGSEAVTGSVSDYKIG